MELRDYLRMLRRGWAPVAVLGLIGLILSSAYLSVAPERWESTATILIAPNRPQSTESLQSGSQFAISSATTVASLMSSGAVLAPAADELGIGVTELEGLVSGSSNAGDALVFVTAAGPSAEDAAATANAVADSASRVVPALLDGTTRVSSTNALVLARVVRVAPEPSTPRSPLTTRILAVGVLTGALLGLALTIARQSLDDRLHEPEDVRTVTSTAVLAVLPRLRRSKNVDVVVRDVPSSPAVEAFRVLRTNLSYLEKEERRSIVFAPVKQDKLAARVPVNLAWSLAQAGRRVLLFDLDLRHSAIARILDLPVGQGASDLLMGVEEHHSIVRKTRQPLLDVITGGPTQERASDLLSNPRMSRILAGAEGAYDYVILNLPPLLSYTDAAVVARLAGQTIVTLASDRTRGPDLKAALEVLGNVHVEPLGLVLTENRGPVVDLPRSRSIRASGSARPGRVWLKQRELDPKIGHIKANDRRRR